MRFRVKRDTKEFCITSGLVIRIDHILNETYSIMRYTPNAKESFTDPYDLIKNTSMKLKCSSLCPCSVSSPSRRNDMLEIWKYHLGVRLVLWPKWSDRIVRTKVWSVLLLSMQLWKGFHAL